MTLDMTSLVIDYIEHALNLQLKLHEVSVMRSYDLIISRLLMQGMILTYPLAKMASNYITAVTRVKPFLLKYQRVDRLYVGMAQRCPSAVTKVMAQNSRTQVF